MTLKIGQKLPYHPPRGLVSDIPTAKPRWHALHVWAMRERFAREALRAEDVFAFYPEETIETYKRGQRIVRKRPQVSRLIYAKFEHLPNWDVLQTRRIITGVVTSGGRPIDIPYSVIRRIQGLPERADVMAEAVVELAALRAGQHTELMEGPLAGLAVEVEDIRDKRVWWTTALGLRGSAPVTEMRNAVRPITPDRLDELARRRGIDFAEACVDVSVQHCGQSATAPAIARLAEIRREA